MSITAPQPIIQGFPLRRHAEPPGCVDLSGVNERSCVLESPVKPNKTSAMPVYESVNVINRSFDQILQELQRLQQVDCFRRKAPIKSVELAIKEIRAWTMVEILDVLHEREESEWTRFGRRRNREEHPRAGPRRRPMR
jgi:hypothetical protein